MWPEHLKRRCRGWTPHMEETGPAAPRQSLTPAPVTLGDRSGSAYAQGSQVPTLNSCLISKPEAHSELSLPKSPANRGWETPGAKKESSVPALSRVWLLGRPGNFSPSLRGWWPHINSPQLSLGRPQGLPRKGSRGQLVHSQEWDSNAHQVCVSRRLRVALGRRLCSTEGHCLPQGTGKPGDCPPGQAGQEPGFHTST